MPDDRRRGSWFRSNRAAAGALWGGVFGAASCAWVGAGAGAAAGTAATGTEEVVLQAESAITFTTPPTAAKEFS